MQSKEVIVVPSFTLNQNAQSNLQDIKYLRSIFSSLSLKISGNLVVTVGATVYEDAVLNLIKKINVELSGLLPISLSGEMAYRIATLDHKVAPTLSDPAATAGTNPFFVEIPLEFALLRHHDPYETLLNTGRVLGKDNNTFKLDITLGTVSDMAVPSGSGAAVALSGLACEVVGRIVNAPRVDYPVNMQRMVIDRQAYAAATYQTLVDLASGRPLKAIAIIAEDASANNSNAVCTKVRIRTSGTNYIRDYNWLQLQDIMKRRYQIATIPTGFVLIDLDDAQFNGEGVLDTSKQQQVYLEVTTGASSILSAMVQEIVNQ